MQQRVSITFQGFQIEKYESYLNGDEFKIFNAKIIQTGELITLKEQSKITAIEENLLRLQQRVKQQNIIEIKMFEKQEQKAFLIIEKTKKLLNDYIHEKEYQIKQEIEKCLLFLQLVKAIQEFHRFGTFHRNLKPIHFVVCENQNNEQVLKLFDFGLAQLQRDEELDKSLEIGSIEYLAPEILNDEYYDKQVDVWSLGVIWYEMLTGEIIIQHNNNELNQEIIDSQIDQNTNQINSKIKRMLKQMLVIQSSKRITLDILFNNLKQFCFDQEDVNHENPLQESNEQITQLNNFKNQIQQQLDLQFKEEQVEVLNKKQISIKKANIDIIQDEINQTSQLINFNNNQYALYMQQKYAILEQGNSNNIDKLQQLDNLFSQFQQQLQASITSQILNQEEQIKKRIKDKENQIAGEVSLQIKQQLLLDYNLKMSIKENEILGFQAYFNGPLALSKQILQETENQIEILSKQLDSSLINVQEPQKYQELKQILIRIKQELKSQRQSPKEVAENIRKFQKQLVKLTLEVDSIEKEIELEQMSNKLQREKNTILHRSNNLFNQYNTIVNDEIVILEDLKNKNLQQKIQNQQNNLFNEKIQKLINQKQILNQELEQLSKLIENTQIENLLLIQKIHFFNDKITQMSNHEKLMSQQFQTKFQILQRLDQNNLQKELQELLNSTIYLMGFMKTYLESSELYCTDLKIISNLDETKNGLLKTLENQSEYLLECQQKLQENNQIVEVNRIRFDQKELMNQGYKILSLETYENITFKLKETINIINQVKVRIQFCDDQDFYKKIIDSWNGIKQKNKQLEDVLQEVTEIMLRNQNKDDELQKQINKIKVLIIQTKLALQLLPSFLQIQRFNQEQQQNQNSLRELSTLVVYIKLYHYSRYLKRFLSLKTKACAKLIQQQRMVQNEVIELKLNKVQNQIEESKKKEQQIIILMEEYLGCLQQKKQAIEIDTVTEHDIEVTQGSEKLENYIKQIIKVKLEANFTDQQLVNKMIEYQKMFEFSPFLCYKLAI